MSMELLLGKKRSYQSSWSLLLYTLVLLQSIVILILFSREAIISVLFNEAGNLLHDDKTRWLGRKVIWVCKNCHILRRRSYAYISRSCWILVLLSEIKQSILCYCFILIINHLRLWDPCYIPFEAPRYICAVIRRTN